MSIELLREKINDIDKTLLQLLAQRLEIAKKIGDYKKKNKLPIFDEKREKQIIEKLRLQAMDLNINPDYVEELYERIMEESRTVQE